MSTTPITALPVLSATSGVVFPEMVVTFRLESEEARSALDSAGYAGNQLLLVPQPGDRSLSIGVIVRVEHAQKMPDGTPAVVIRGIERARVGAAVAGDGDGLWVEVQPIDGQDADADADGGELAVLATEYRALATRLLELAGAPTMASALDEVSDPGALADTIGWWPDLDFERRVELLETVDVRARLLLATDWVRELVAEAELMNKIRSGVNEDLEKGQREAILRRQMDAIRAELGDAGDDDVVAEFREKLAALDVSDSVRVPIEKEIDRLDRTGDQGTEAGWIRTWLDHVFEIPWGEVSEDDLDLEGAAGTLDADHTGLEDVKDRILEFLAVRKLHAERDLDGGHSPGGSILVLVGPPGVGKTSLGESVARALGREFVRMSLGGITDEAEIRGHRRTYVGARPGRIVRALADAGTMNPVVLLDEIDKVGVSYRGGPSSAFLEVLDPAQNSTFRDHYLEMDLDLSNVFFIATANVADQIPGPLLDRMEVIALNGYSADEKWEIARDHLLPRIYERNGVTADEVDLPEDVVRSVVAKYTREAGVRRLEQRLDRLVRRAARKVAEGEDHVEITSDQLRDALGRPAPNERPTRRVTAPGIASGLAVSGAGGDVLFVEAVATDGKAGLSLTGQLGEVMQESGEIALAYLGSHADELGLSIPDDTRFHVHFPAGGTPKDGPSAGVTMTTALASLLSGRIVRDDVAMSGEVTLHGKVLPIGGVKEKVLAAHRAGVSHVILPEENRHDAEDLPDDVRDAIELHFADQVSEVLEVALAA